MILYWIPIVLGILAGFILAGYAMVNIACPYERVAFYLTILATDVMTVFLAYLLIGPTLEIILFTFAFTQCLVWFIMDKHTMVHYQHED
jgi:hypothetical protein